MSVDNILRQKSCTSNSFTKFHKKYIFTKNLEIITYTMKILDDLINLITYKEPNGYNFVLPDAEEISLEKSTEEKKNSNKENEDKKVFPAIDVSKDYIKSKYSFGLSNDIKIREFSIHLKGKLYSAFLLFIDGMIDSKSINKFVIEPLMLKEHYSQKDENVVNKAISSNLTVRRVKKFDLKTYILECLVPQNDVSTEEKFKDIIQKVNAGNSALFIDTIDCAFMIDAKGFDKRSVSPPENESIIRGSQEGFIESIRTNTTLLRRIVNSENLIIEETSVGKISNTQVAICYLKNVTNDGLVKEVKHRIENVGVDYLVSSGQLEQLIDDSDISVPQLISSERPDRVAAYILEGRVAILVNRYTIWISCTCGINRLFDISRG